MRASFVLPLAAATSASALALYARAEWWGIVLGWIGLVPWLAALDRATSWRTALLAGVLMCEAFVVAVFSWFPSALQAYTGTPWVVALLVLVLVAPLLEPQFLTFALARYCIRGKTPDTAAGRTRSVSLWRTALVGAGVYVGTEWLSPKLFADTLGHGLYPARLLRQAADIGGAPGLTFVLIVANECGLAALRALYARRPRAALLPGVGVVALVLLLVGYGTVRLQMLRRSDARGAGISAGLVQANITHYGELAAQLGTYDAARMILDTHFTLSAEAIGRAKLDLLIWPETVYPTTFGAPKSADGAAFDREIGAFVTETGVPLVFGAYDSERGNEFNAAVFLEPARNGQLAFETYRKASLFPLTERVPALVDFDLVRRWLPWLGTWTPGAGPQVRSVVLADGRPLQIAPLICYDALDPQHAIEAVRRGAEVIVTLSNDSWFSYGSVPRLILMLSAFRSVETRRPQLRATNTGISAVIDATGEFVGTIGVDQRGTLVATVIPEGNARTLMLAWGDWFGPSALVFALLMLALGQVIGVRRRVSGAPRNPERRGRHPTPNTRHL